MFGMCTCLMISLIHHRKSGYEIMSERRDYSTERLGLVGTLTVSSNSGHSYTLDTTANFTS